MKDICFSGILREGHPYTRTRLRARMQLGDRSASSANEFPSDKAEASAHVTLFIAAADSTSSCASKDHRLGMTSLCNEKWSWVHGQPNPRERGAVAASPPPYSVGRVQTSWAPDPKLKDMEQGAEPPYLASRDDKNGGLRVLETVMVSPGQSARVSVMDQRQHWRYNKSKRHAVLLAVVYALVLIPSFFIFIAKPMLLPSLPTHVINGCDAPAVFPKDTYPRRLAKLASALGDGALYVAEPGASAEYYTSISSSKWFLSERPFLISVDSKATLRILVPSFELARAQLLELPQGLDVQWVEWKEDEDPFRVLQLALAASAEVMEVQVDGMLRAFVIDGLAEALSGTPIGFAGPKVVEIRERKEKAEIDRLRCANQLTLAAIRSTADRLKLGMTESQTHKILVEQMAKRGLVDWDALVLFGPNAALPHGSGTDRRLGRGDMILVDAGGSFGGYVADITRTWALRSSKIPASHIQQWESVAAAQRAAIAHLTHNSSATLSSLDSTARETLRTPELMTHRLGHGIGLEGHESPYLVSGPLGERGVKSGMVFSVEPGVYDVQEGYGVRIEDCYVVGVEGEGEWLTGPVEGWGHM